MRSTLNHILYGPPGTGKTYSTINKAVEIIDGHTDADRSELKQRFQELLIDDWDNPTGQIAFITFHQSMSYEDFIEGIKPDVDDMHQVTYKTKPGVFKSLCALAGRSEKKTVNIDEATINLSPELFRELYDNFAEQLPKIGSDEQGGMQLTTVTGKPFELHRNSVGSVTAKVGSQETTVTMSCNELVKILFEGKKPHYPSYAPKVIEKILEGKEYSESPSDNSAKDYVLIIDEINRGNVSQIFGELITLIEEDKRQGMSEALQVTLPYSKEKFSVPPNLHIIGTMNTADRSVEALDTALRRRFSFTEMSPDPVLLEGHNIDLDSGQSISLSVLLTKVNRRIGKLLDRDHLIGHSYFLQAETLDDLKVVFHNRLLPLLQEYFFGDLGKVSLILGKDFFTVPDQEEGVFAVPLDSEEADLADKPTNHFRNVLDMSNADFTTALSTLMGNH